MKSSIACLNIQSQRDGAAMLATVVGLSLILGIYTAGVFAYVGTQRRAVANQMDMEQALTAAEAGIELAAAYIQQQGGIFSGPVYTNGSVSGNQSNAYQVAIVPLSWYEFGISSTGTVYRTTWADRPMSVSSVGRVITLKRVWFPTWAQFGLWSRVNGEIYFISGEVFSGRVHSDDKLWFQGNPRFNDLVTSLANTYGGSTSQVNFVQGFNLNTAAGSMANVPFSNLLHQASVDPKGFVCPKNTYIDFYGTNYTISTNAISTSLVTTTNKGKITTNKWISTNWYTSPLAGEKQLIYVQGNTYVGGTLDGRVTIIADGDINVTNNLIYADDPRTNAGSDNALGLISKSNVWIATSAPTNMSLFAHIMATGTNDGFGAVNYNSRPTGTLTMYGGIVQDTRQPVGLANRSYGYLKCYSFDSRFVTNPPPFYPVQTESATYKDWEEHAPAIPEKKAP